MATPVWPGFCVDFLAVMMATGLHMCNELNYWTL